VEYDSIYLFRGVNLLNDEKVIAPHVKWTWGGLTTSYCGYYGRLPEDARYGEADFAADYTFTLGKAALTVGALTYQYNGNAERILTFLDTYEVYSVLKLNVFLTPTLSYNHDLDKVKGGYGSFGISQGFPLGTRAALNLSGSVGFDFHYNNRNVEKGSLNDVLFTAQVPVKINGHFSVYGQIQRSLAQKALDAIVRADRSLESVYGDQTVVTAGAVLTF